MSNGESGEKKSGCKKFFIIGCLSLCVIAIVAIVGGYFVVTRAVKGLVENYTEAQPLDLPEVELPESEIQSTLARTDAFKQAVEAGEPTEPLVLSSDEVNAVIQRHPDFAKLSDKAYVTLEGDKVHGQVSIPLGDFLPMAAGRYFNGSAVFSVSLAGGRLAVYLDSLEVGAEPVPEEFMAQLRQANLAENFVNDPSIAPVIEKLREIEVADGKLVITPRGP